MNKQYTEWNVALTDAEMRLLASGIDPSLIRPDALVMNEQDDCEPSDNPGITNIWLELAKRREHERKLIEELKRQVDAMHKFHEALRAVPFDLSGITIVDVKP